ncbi:MAG: type IV pilin protein [Pseudomonadota bacterium]
MNMNSAFEYRRNRGFTLVELMIVVVILAILVSIAFPLYQEQVRKTHRADGKSALMEIMQAEERYRTTEFTYTTDLVGDLGYSSDPVISDESYYQVAATACAGDIRTCVQLTATPINGQTGDKCGNLTLDSRGNKGRSGSAPMDQCW